MTKTDTYSGEFTDERIAEMRDDPRITVVNTHVPKWGASDGRQFVQFELQQASDFDEYQHKTDETAIYPDEFPDFVSAGLVYVALGLAEAGEVQEKVKKAIREDDVSYLNEIPAEAGDVLWYLARLPKELSEIDDVDFDGDLSDIAEGNLDKLFDRKARDKLEGSGDKR